MQLYFLNYNTYGNRIVKKEESISDYLDYEVARETNSNFNINDGVNTKFTVNSSTVGNYLLVVDNSNNIHSRWFIMESKYTRNGQHFVTLKRDLMVDYYDSIITAPCFIEKATVGDGDPAIYNNENMTFNQIKTSEILLKDETSCPWLVGYIATKDSSNTVKTYDCQAIFNTSTLKADVSVAGLSNWEYYDYINNSNFIGPIYNIIYRADIQGMKIDAGSFTNTEPLWFAADENGTVYDRTTGATSPAAYNINKGSSEYWSSVSNSLQNTWYPNAVLQYANTLRSAVEAIEVPHTASQVSSLTNLNGKILEDTVNQKFYKVKVLTQGGVSRDRYVEVGSNLYNSFITMLDNVKDSSNTARLTRSAYYNQANRYRYQIRTTAYQLTLEELNGFTANINIGATRYHLEDAPYDMFCMPYENDIKIYDNGVEKYTTNKEMAFQVFMELARKYGGDSAKFLYDIQLLPYCPVRYIIQTDNKLDVMGDSKAVSYITDENSNIVGGLFFARSSQFTLNINSAITITNKKVECLTDKYRLCSPNYNGVFEFNAAKNNGVNFYNIDCTYKPYNPYIHVNPDFGGLYGEDFNDNRGLIVGGDFSLPQTTSAWESYQLSNKNYQQAFDRQILNMEVNNSINNVKSGINILGSAISTGLATGNALVGVGSAVTGGIDMGLQIAQQQETLDFTKDMFGYNLGNIQALPTGLAKTSALTYNNKIFPFVEKYTCTDTEKNALINKLTYNGMTIMRIGTIQEFLQSTTSYIKGQIIRLQVSEDNHLLEAIREEINKGVYI